MHTLDEIYELVGKRSFVPRTGQTISYTVGDDGDLERGVEWPTPRFIEGTTGVVTDTLTGLVWLQEANCWGSQNWATATMSVTALISGECGLSDGSTAGDWRLPNVRELQSLIDYGKALFALPGGHPFKHVQSGFYWSSTTFANDENVAWHVYPYVGNVAGSAKTDTDLYVWPVRGGQ